MSEEQGGSWASPTLGSEGWAGARAGNSSGRAAGAGSQQHLLLGAAGTEPPRAAQISSTHSRAAPAWAWQELINPLLPQTSSHVVAAAWERRFRKARKSPLHIHATKSARPGSVTRSESHRRHR